MWSEVLGGDISYIARVAKGLDGDFVEMSYKMAVLVKLYDKGLWKGPFFQARELILTSFEGELSYNFGNSV